MKTFQDFSPYNGL